MTTESRTRALAARVGTDLKSYAVDDITRTRADRLAITSAREYNKVIQARVDAATVFSEAWANTTAWTGTGTVVSGRMYSSAGLTRAAPATTRWVARATLHVTGGTGKFAYLGVGSSTAAADQVGVGLDATSTAAIIRGSNISSASLVVPRAFPALTVGDYLCTVARDEFYVSFTIQAVAGGQAVYGARVPASSFPATPATIFMSANDTTAGGVNWGPVSIYSELSVPPSTSWTVGGVSLWGTNKPLSFYRADSVTGIGHIVSVPGDDDSSSPSPVALFMHQALNGGAVTPWTDTKMANVVAALEAAGYIIASSDNGGTSGATLWSWSSSVDPDFESSVGAAKTYETAGSYGQRMKWAAQTDVSAYAAKTLATNPTDVGIRFIYTHAARPTTSFGLLNGMSTGAVAEFRADLTNSGQLRIRNSSTTVVTGTVSLALNTEYRMEVFRVGTTLTFRAYRVSDNVLMDSISGTVGGNALQYLFIGNQAPITGTYGPYTYDEIVVKGIGAEVGVVGSGSTAGPLDTYGNASGQLDEAALVAWARQHFNTGSLVLYAVSMGSLVAQNLLITKALGDIAAVATVSSVTDLFAMEQNPTYQAAIWAAYGVPDTATFQAVAANNNPAGQDGWVFRGVPQRFYVGASDTTAPTATQVTPFAAKIAAYAPEASVQAVTGVDHMDASLYQGTDVVAFFQRFVHNSDYAIVPDSLLSATKFKLDKLTSRSSTDSVATWRTNLTDTLATTVQNIAEHVVNMKASVSSPGFMAGWVNEWGALRGTSPYTWGDSLLRAVRQSGDGITAGNFVEMEDRTASSLKVWGRAWVGGGLVRNNYPIRECYEWRTGDADPTAGGTIALPSSATWIITLSVLNGTVPSWVPANAIIIEPSS